MTHQGPDILIVDDIQDNIDLIGEFLELRGYTIHSAINGKEALQKVYKINPDLIITDAMMPIMDGFKLTEELRENPITKLTPVIMVTSLSDKENRIKGIESGVNDFISHPTDLYELFVRVKSLVSLKHYTDELENAEKVIFTLANAVESRDEYTGGHCGRMAKYAEQFAKHLKLNEEDIKNCIRGGFLHDIGKIMVPDAILLKEGKLTEDEWVVMKRHPEEGESICRPLRTMRGVLPIIRGHQERWDGSGYPDGLKGEEIPLLTRIVSTVDFYDALSTDRPYRRALDNDECFAIMREETSRGKWDSNLIEKFIEMLS
jgi:putative two-component system response regulator